MDGVKLPAGKDAPNEKGLMNFIAPKYSGKWLIKVIES
jgi:hypothetical protein